MKRWVMLLMAVGLAALVGVAVAAPVSYVSGAYSGHTSQQLHGHTVAISFVVVKPAHGHAYVTNIAYKTVDKCPHNSFVETHTEPAHIAINASGNFTDAHAYGAGGRNHVKLTGHLQGKSASGSVTDDNVSPPPVCHGTATWSAHHS